MIAIFIFKYEINHSDKVLLTSGRYYTDSSITCCAVIFCSYLQLLSTICKDNLLLCKLLYLLAQIQSL